LEKPYLLKKLSSCSIRMTFVMPDETARKVSTTKIIVQTSLMITPRPGSGKLDIRGQGCRASGQERKFYMQQATI
jgi:hypothetical protein